MKKYPVIKRIMSIVLALTLMFLTPTAVLAQDSNSSAATITTEESESKGDLNTDSNKDSDKESDTKKDDLSVDTKENTADTSVGETDKAETSEKSKEESEKTDSSNSSSESGKDKEADKDARVNEKKKDTKTVDQDKTEEASSECEHHEFEYKSNEDGTHTKACKECGQEFTEDCELSEEDVCQLCGYKKVVEEDKTFEIKIKDFTITAVVPAGAFDEEVEFKASQIDLSSSEMKLVDEVIGSEDLEKMYAFDLHFETEGNEVEPKEGCNVNVSIESSVISADEVIHIKDDETVETLESEVSEETVSFETDSFSTIVLASYFPNGNNKVLYDNPAYGTAKISEQYNKTLGTSDDLATNERFGVTVYLQNNEGVTRLNEDYTPHLIPPLEGDQCYYFGTGKNNEVEITLTAPTNYYVAKVSHYTYYPGKFNERKKIKTEKLSGYQTEGTVKFKLKRVKNKDKICNAIIVDLQAFPTELTGDNVSVEGAKLVNYKNGKEDGSSKSAAIPDNDTFGNHFLFNNGQTTDIQSNHCSYRQVYQGLAARNISDGRFRLAWDNGQEFFPNYNNYQIVKKWWQWDKYSYITNYYDNAKVQFNLDKDGYYTLDSSKYKYYYNSKTNTVEPQKGSMFRPFDNEKKAGFEDNHFGMMLPISFSVAEDGLTKDGKETIFKFFGDDDVFVYVDGILVLDLGGIHDAVRGQINFATGEVLIQGDKSNQLTSSKNDTCYAKDAWGNSSKGIGTTNLYDLIPESGPAQLSQKNHVLTVVYFERGAHESNCKISWNFTKTETRTVDFKSFKLDENLKALAGAEFTLYTEYDPQTNECSNVPNMGIGVPAVTVSDEEGSIEFTNLSAGSLTKGQDSVSKTYYMKETKAPDGYNKPSGAVWKLVLTAYRNGDKKQELYAMNAEAKALSLDANKESTIHSDRDSVSSIKNNPIKFAKKLTITKKVTYGSDTAYDADAQYIFLIEQGIKQGKNIVYSPMGNQPFKIGDKEAKTNEFGQFALKADEVATFENLYETNYRFTEICVWSNYGYSLANYDTTITVDGAQDNASIYKSNDPSNRIALIDFESKAENGTKYVASEKQVQYENSLVKVIDWKLIKKSTSGKTLRGAEFTLASESQGSTGTYYGKSNDNGLVIWYASEKDRANDSNPIEVPVGSYTLSESAAPSGYAKSEDVWHIIINKQNGVMAYINNQGDLAEHTTVEKQALANGGTVKTVTFTFENEIAYTLPETGGSGTYIFTISGVLVMIGAALLLYKTKKTKKK